MRLVAVTLWLMEHYKPTVPVSTFSSVMRPVVSVGGGRSLIIEALEAWERCCSQCVVCECVYVSVCM